MMRASVSGIDIHMLDSKIEDRRASRSYLIPYTPPKSVLSPRDR